MRTLRHLRGVAGLQAFRGAMERHQRLMLQASGCVRQMNVAIDQARQYGGTAQVDDFGAGGDRHTGGGPTAVMRSP
jgi:hypothetical protein